MAAPFPGEAMAPRRVWATNEAGERISIDQMQRSMPYIDIESGTQKRLVTRDPIAGLGNLPPERDTLAGSHINHKGQLDASQRDPISGTGQLGAEYNCMYTTKDAAARRMRTIAETPAESENAAANRNPILMEGNLGLELDPMRPHGGRPRNHSQRDANRNPIAGTGDFGPKEWDPIYKYRGRMRRSRTAHSEIRRDPICGTGQFAPSEGDALGRPGRRSRSAVSPRNPITHVKNPGQPRTPPNEPRARGDPRDPILGEGFRRKEMMDLWLTPENYCFRSYLLPQGKHKQQEPEAKKDPPKKTIRKIPREPKRTKSTEPKEENSTVKKETTKKKPPPTKKQPLKKKEKDKEEQLPEKKTLKGKKTAMKTKKPSLANGEPPNANGNVNDIDQKENEAPDKDIDRDSIEDHSQKSPENLQTDDKIMEDSLTFGNKIDPLEYQDGTQDMKSADDKPAEHHSSIMADSLENANLIIGDSGDNFVESTEKRISEEEPENTAAESADMADESADHVIGTDDIVKTEEPDDVLGLAADDGDNASDEKVPDPELDAQAALDNQDGGNDATNEDNQPEEW